MILQMLTYSLLVFSNVASGKCTKRSLFELQSVSNDNVMPHENVLTVTTGIYRIHTCSEFCTNMNCESFSLSKTLGLCMLYKEPYPATNVIINGGVFQHFTKLLCPKGWHSFQSSCYYLSTDTTTWSNSKMICQGLRGFLAKVENVEENSYLEKIIKDTNSFVPAWIGGNDIEEEGNYVWTSNNTKISFTDWAPNQPNNYGKYQHCIRYEFNTQWIWNDERCEKLSRFLCQWSC